ncbi:TPM domain-containing protein [Aurantibacter sp.]|uniref:TPM domain-containing protein n=1 Tax=Aurantibacter sp. TaxID=2807103 RepID=UPI0035C7CD9A
MLNRVLKSNYKKRLKTLLFETLILCALFSTSITLGQFEIPKIPNKQTSVYDYIGLLNNNQKLRLEQDLIRYSDSTSTQIVVAIISSTKGENINYLAANWGEKWGIGDAEKDNGILILLAKNDKKITISTGRGTEHLLTDAMCKRIIDQAIIPQFKKNNYYKGLQIGVATIYMIMNGEYKNTNSGNSDFPVGFVIFIFFVFIIIIIALSKKNNGSDNHNGKHFRRDSGSSILDAIILSNMGRSSGGGWSSGSSGGSFGGGGFSGGFGGGSFGGGGASGGW